MPGRKIFHASFAGARTKLANAYTICEYDGTVDSSGNLVDVTGAHHLTVEGTPTSEPSGILKNDSKVWESRVLNGTTDRYICAHHSDFDVLAGDFTATVIWKNVAFVSSGYIFGTFDTAANTGLFLNWATNIATFGMGTGSGTLATPVMDIATYGTQHIFQVVKDNNLVSVTYNGVRYAAIDASTAVDSSVGFSLGDVGGGALHAPTNGSITYFRLDSCAYTGDELEFQRGVLLGHAVWTQNKTVMYFRRPVLTSGDLHSGYACVQGRLYRQSVDALRIEDDGLLIEETRGNYAYANEDLTSAYWTKLDTDTISANSAVAPTGETTMDGVIASVNNTTHGVTQLQSTFSKSIYLAVSCYAKAGAKSWLKLSNSQDVTRYVYFDIAQGRIGTIGAGIDATTVGMTPMANGIWRCYCQILMDAAPATFQYYPADSDGVDAFAGNGVDVSLWLWGFSREATTYLGTFQSVTHPTSYFPYGDRAADDFRLRPFAVEMNFGDYPIPEWQTDLSNDFVQGSTFTMNGRSFTQSGDILVKYMSNSERCVQSKSAMGAIISTDAAFNKNTAFSISAFYTPERNDACSYIGSLLDAVTMNGWGVLQYGPDISFFTCNDGGITTEHNKVLNCVHANEPTLITVYYDGVDTSYLYINDYPVSVYNGHTGLIADPNPQFMLGGAIYESLIHSYAIYDEQLGQVFHDARYARMKQYGFFPARVSSTTEKNKFRVRLEAKALYKAGDTNSGTGARHFISLAGNSGVSESGANNLRVYFDDAQYFTTYFCDNVVAANAHYFKKDALLHIEMDHSHTYDVEFDCADLSNSALLVDDSDADISSTLMAGTADFIATDTLLRIGQSEVDVVDGNLHVKDVKIFLGS